MSDIGTGGSGGVPAHPGPLQRWRPLASAADEHIGGAAFTAVSMLVLLDMGVTACTQARFSLPSPISQFKESTLWWKTGKGHLFNVATLEDVLERIVTKCLCPTPRDLEKVLVRGITGQRPGLEKSTSWIQEGLKTESPGAV